MKLTKLKNTNKGFTIVELMIATAVFATAMLVLVFGVIGISHNYYKGLTESKVQDTTRNIANDLSESIQLNGGNITSLTAAVDKPNPSTTITTNGYCIGGQEYDFILGFELQSANNAAKHQTTNASRATSPCNPGGTAQDLWTGIPTGNELLDQNMRITNLSVTEEGRSDFYDIDVKVIFGDDDLLCNTGVSISGTQSCNSSSTMTSTSNFIDTDPSHIVKCKLNAGSQFCATAEINTTVEKRVI